MNLIEMKDELEGKIAKSATPQARITVGILLVLLVVGMFWKEFHRTNTPTTADKAKASTQFGEALGRAGIETQVQPSH